MEDTVYHIDMSGNAGSYDDFFVIFFCFFIGIVLSIYLYISQRAGVLTLNINMKSLLHK